ncbi:MAG: T9SS type A sorting domain-containing protein [bacterium]|nr:T9SS type A sorting domain-containing protein [bacterium]
MKKILLLLTLLIFSLTVMETFAGPNYYQGSWRWRNDDGDVYTATWKNSLETPIIFSEDENVRLRLELLFSDIPGDTSETFTLIYTDDINDGVWTPISNDESNAFVMSPSNFIVDTAWYFDNQLLPGDPYLNYIKTITFDSTNPYNFNFSENGIYELEYSIRKTANLEESTSYYFTLANISIGGNYPIIMTPPIFWWPQQSGTSNTLEDVFFIDDKSGWAVGGDGTIIHTSDGGVTWVTQQSGTTNLLNDVYFTNAITGTIVGQNGTILRTNDGGNTWTSQNSGTSHHLQSVYFIDTNNGWAVGGEGSILHTTNGGTTWNVQYTGNGGVLYSVFFFDELNGITIGSVGYMYRTSDGGNIWIRQQNVTSKTLYDMSFPEPSTGTIVGEDGIILLTSDGGVSWIIQPSGTTIPLRSVHFIDSMTGWAVGSTTYGKIIKTTDGGSTWVNQSSGAARGLNDVYFADIKNGWIVGANGTILSTKDIASSIVEHSTAKLIDFILSQNYPNPFNPSTTISWQSPVSSWQTLKVYDLLGREVATLVDEYKPAGRYEVKFDASHLTTGVYFYRLWAEEFTSTKKLILMK